ncbi:hypothetical protein TTHERM_00219520 (macronuclear) [Tetrahymena thermophila SB210]|uniref:Uncharacterized protein n=1 Tax=Tetrahymena thermophila (strain SB210) TaxID=312017 RepID=I7MFN5_TETTS|nr:hypothetical protein TTHERM_00219520 [Tetrahymena thermophila SB210]EAS00379.1 hypothetical protein TTHERM_00219520 [Tetrahymena thermophila SB210]|eukprot:XP_001020624.1 hypothetical protein TTHERM_00219520 [Tetrahymena thermophila SB210]
MSSPIRKANHTPSIPFNEEAEKTAIFLPAIDLKSQNTTPRSSLVQAPLSHQATANSQSSIQSNFIYNQKSVEKTYIHDNSKRNYQSSCQQDILNGVQRISKEPSNQKELGLLKEASIIHNYGPNRRSIQLNQSNERSGQNLYNNSYGYQINLERDLRLNQSYEVNISNSARSKQNNYSNSINSSLVSINNQQKYRSQSCQRKPSDQLILGSIDFNNFNHIYAFTPQSAPNSQIEGTFITRKNINQIKTLSYPHTNIVDQHISQQQHQRQAKEDNLITLNKIKESTTPNPLSNPFDPLKQETQIHFDTDGCRKKMQDEAQSQSEIKRDNRFPKGFFVQTPTSSKRRTIRLNQNIYQTPIEKKENQIQSFTNINEYQFTFGDEESEIQDNNLQNNIQSSKNSNMYQLQNQSLKVGYQFDNNQLEKIKQCNQDDKHKDYLNQQITKNDVCRSVAAKGGISLSANQQRPDENAVIDQVTFGLFPMRDHSSNQNQNLIIHSPLNESPVQTTSAGVRKYQKPKSLLFKKMFEKVNSLIDDQKRADCSQHQENSEIGDSPLHGSERLINSKNYQQRQNMAKVFHSRQSSPKNKQFRQPNGKKIGLASSILEQIKDADNQIQMINYAQSRNNQESPQDRECVQQTPKSIENSKKNSVENDKNQVFLQFQKKLSFQLNNNQNTNTTTETQKNPQLYPLNSQVKNKNSIKSSDHQQQDGLTQVVCQNNDKLNKWLQEHSQFKQSSIADYQMYVGISCYSVTPNQQQSARASYNQEDEQNKLPNNTFTDKTRLYNNVQISNNIQQMQITNQIQNNNDTSINNIQRQSAQKIQIQSNKLSLKQKQTTKKHLQANFKLNSASDLDIQNAQIGQSSNCSPKSLKKKAVVRKLSSLQINDQSPSPDENAQLKQNQCNQIIDKLGDLQKISQDSIQIKNSQYKTDKQQNKNLSIKQSLQFEKISSIKKDSKIKGENTKNNANKNIGPWINEKDDIEDDIMMERILQNQTQIKIQ